MEPITRRTALRVLATGGVGGAAASLAKGSHGARQAAPDAVAMLFDATICTGCKACVSACSEANDLPPDTKLSGGIWQMPIDLNSETKNIIKLWQDPADPKEFSFVKHQCMHCIDPACVSACPFHALDKHEKGVVAWEPSLCIGCRYCEVACPFEVPKFEWDKFNPKIVKCEFCNHRLKEGLEPGCTAACPTGAVVFGTRENLLARAKGRIGENPGRYYEDRVYGENEAGGTQVLYLSGVPFENLGLPSLPHHSMAEYATGVHQVLYRWMMLPVALYLMLVAVIKRRWKLHQGHAVEYEKQTGLKEQL